MTTYTLSVDPASTASTFTDIDLRRVFVLPVAAATVASTFTNIDLRRVFVLPVSAMSVVSTFTDIADHCHQFFYWATGAVQRGNMRATYRMGAEISDLRFPYIRPTGTFRAAQSIIVPEGINADDRFSLAP